jgi:uncharacterized protein
MTDLSRVRRKPDRASYDRTSVYAVLDEAPFCHVGTVRDGRPVVLPMAHARLGDVIVLHGSPAAGLFRDVRRGSAVCVTATILDGLVLARSARNHSMNYRSVTVHGHARLLTEPDEVLAGMRALVNHVMPDRWSAVRPPNAAEIRETAIWQVSMEHASVKSRTGSTLDPPEDRGLPVWAGVLPAALVYTTPIPAEGSPYASPK